MTTQSTNKIDTYTFMVDPFDTDCQNRLSWSVLGTRILSAATHHARRRGFDRFEKDGIPYLWVLSRMIIEVDRPLFLYPRQQRGNHRTCPYHLGHD